jgi:hypothetical protein
VHLCANFFHDFRNPVTGDVQTPHSQVKGEVRTTFIQLQCEVRTCLRMSGKQILKFESLYSLHALENREFYFECKSRQERSCELMHGANEVKVEFKVVKW